MVPRTLKWLKEQSEASLRHFRPSLPMGTPLKAVVSVHARIENFVYKCIDHHLTWSKIITVTSLKATSRRLPESREQVRVGSTRYRNPV